MQAILRLLVVGSALGVTTAVTASGQGHLVGIRGGVNIAKMGGADLNAFESACACTTGSRTALDVAGFMRFDLGGVLKLQPEVHYVGKGTKFDLAGTAVEIRTAYVEVPVLLVVAPRIQGPLHPTIFGGGALAVKVGCSLAGGGASLACNNSSVSLPVKSTDYGLVFGVGLGYAMGAGELLLDGRYNLGFSDFLDTNPTPALKYRGVAVTAGYSFRIRL